MKHVKHTAAGLAILIGGLAIVGALLPRRAQLERSIDIAVPPANVFAVLNTLHSFKQWSPWAALDPATQYRYTGAWAGTGARMEWEGANPKPGTGSAIIIASEPYRRIALTLDLGAHGKSAAAFVLTPAAGGTHLVWHFDVDFGWNLFARYGGLIANRWGYGDYQTGLQNLKRFAESLPKTDLAGADIKLIQMQPVSIVYVSGKTTTDGRDVANALDAAYAQAQAFIAAHHLKVNGAPMAVTRVWDPAHNNYEFDAALPASWDRMTVPANSAVKLGQTLGGQVVLATYTGPYSGTGKVYDQIAAWLAANGLTATGLSWEQYLNDPANTPDARLVTRIYTPVR
ncbi:MAG TPA: SRPBCC family protein [Gammaproteobacteria bacterium]|nr:SRPBCC family protein [Gammaproteobacteria bacterium]